MAAITTSVETYIGYTLSGSTVPTWTQLDDYIKDGIVDIVKLIIVLYAMWFAWDTGIISDVINYFSK